MGANLPIPCYLFSLQDESVAFESLLKTCLLKTCFADLSFLLTWWDMQKQCCSESCGHDECAPILRDSHDSQWSPINPSSTSCPTNSLPPILLPKQLTSRWPQSLLHTARPASQPPVPSLHSIHLPPHTSHKVSCRPPSMLLPAYHSWASPHYHSHSNPHISLLNVYFLDLILASLS